MTRRSRTLLSVLAGLTILLCTGTAFAHRLDAQAFVLPDNRVQIESWFSSGVPARGAKVKILRSDKSLVAEGQLDEKGIFVFRPAMAETLTVIVDAGEGHRKELRIVAEDLARAHSNSQDDSPLSSSTRDPVPLADRSAPYPIKDVLLGITFLLALAAFVMSLRNQRQWKRK